MNLLQETKFIMDKYGIQANKALGQNFLIDENTVNGIIEAAKICQNDLVIEIGPGLGTLTSRLIEKAGKVIAIELDKKVLDILHDRFLLYKNFELINDDVLKVNLKEIINENLNEGITNCKVVANLPYYITTPIIMKLLQDNLPLCSITVMVQKEVAKRLTAIPGEKETGAITYSIYYYTEPYIILDVPRNCFIPAPEVDSAVIKLDLLSTPRVKVNDEEKFFNIIKAAFSQKRKTLINGLVNNKIISSKQEAENLLTSVGLDTRIRGEKLSIEDFAKLSQAL
jgi:16S rRNA (adenine1518-N6/adenine1519-N6)-dimethyltransferase